ncbi:holo-ACP synthase [Leucobacter chironomi]|uniref:holo-ACP synthase n=1 Tax=Leucobacter chironomi TaxID=491918 RepID=UPI000408BB6C|nr:holo-ACP synthase [Leucobacter chironomi]
MIRGIGVDTVDIARFERQLERTPSLRTRLFAPAERELPLASLAARFAAKEALIKALGGSGRLGWHDLEVVRDADRAPSFAATPALVAALAGRGADRAHLSMTHDAGVATAFVIVESAAPIAGMSEVGGTLAASPTTDRPTPEQESETT